MLVGKRFQVKRITVLPGQALSPQNHFHRSEHWIVVEGTARVTLNGEVSLLAENQSIYIPVGAQHRIENPGRIPAVCIKVQTARMWARMTPYAMRIGMRGVSSHIPTSPRAA